MKHLVRHNFSRAASTYDDFAKTQHCVATDFAEKLSGLTAPASILEIGCGTGFLSQHLINFNCPLISSDLSLPMIARLNIPTQLKLVLDGEHLPFQEQFDWIVSSLAFQWFEKPHLSLPILKQHCKTLAFTTLGPNNFPEWKKFCAQHNLEDYTRLMLSTEELKTILGPNTSIEETYYSEHHPNWLSFWNGIYKIGANTSRGYKKTPIAKSLLQQEPIICSYQVLTVISR